VRFASGACQKGIADDLDHSQTWSVDELVTASMLNVGLRDNLNALKAPPTAQRVLDQAADYTTTSTSFVDVDPVALTLTITSAGATCWCTITARCSIPRTC